MSLEKDAQEVFERLKVELVEWGFPTNCCKIAVVEVHRRGYGIISGLVMVDNYCGMGTTFEWPHYWNHDPVTDTDFDITASQFNIHIKDKKMPEIMKWGAGENPYFKAIKRNISPDYVF